MANELKSLSDLFQKRIFRIPDYQRGYAWKQEQLIDFWEDIRNLDRKRFHYTGLLSLKKISKNDKSIDEEDKWLTEGQGYDFYHIVDGQQRLTTFSILMFELIDFVKKLPENRTKQNHEIIFNEMSLETIINSYIAKSKLSAITEKVYLFGYAKDNPSFEYLIHAIYQEPHGSTLKETYYTRNLKNAKLFFHQNILDLYHNEGVTALVDLFTKITLKLKFNIHEIDDEYDVFVAFETMNNRGKRLSNLELLKNRMIYLVTLYGDELPKTSKNKLRKVINESWQEIYSQLGRNAQNLLHDDDLLKAHWILYFQYTRRRGDDYIGYLLNKKFTAKNILSKNARVLEDQNQKEIFDDTPENDDYEDENVASIETGISSILEPKEIENYVFSLKDFSKFWFFSYFPDESSDLDVEEKKWINKLNRLKMAEFRPIVATVISRPIEPNVRIALFKAIERFVFSFFRMGRWRGNFKNSYYYNKSRAFFNNLISIDEITTDLNNDVQSEMNIIIDSFIKETRRRYEKSEGFYSWSDLKYFLYEYEDSLIPDNRDRKILWDDYSRVDRNKVSIEHILPQTPDNKYWKSLYSSFSKEEMKILSNSLGNLLPLALSINITLQNDSFPDKKNRNNGYAVGSYSELEVAKNADWTAELIKKRGIKLLEFLKVRWDIPLSEEQNEQLLNLAFIKIK